MPLFDFVGRELGRSERLDPAEEQRVFSALHLWLAAERAERAHARHAQHQHRVDALRTGIGANCGLGADLDPGDTLRRSGLPLQQGQQAFDHGGG